MENSKMIQFKLNYRDAARGVEDKKLQVEVGRERVEDLLKSLRALGLDVSMEPTSTGAAAYVTIAYPEVNAALKATRRGGMQMYIEVPEGSPIKHMTVGDALEWMGKHTSKENARAMGCSVSQYFRRKPILERIDQGTKIDNLRIRHAYKAK